MSYTEYIIPGLLCHKGEEIARVRVKLETYRSTLLWSTTQLEGLCFGNKWISLERYDFTTKEKPNIHVHREYLSTEHKEEFTCHPKLLVSETAKILSSLRDDQIIDRIKKREGVFLKEGK